MFFMFIRLGDIDGQSKKLQIWLLLYFHTFSSLEKKETVFCVYERITSERIELSWSRFKAKLKSFKS